MNLKKLSSKLEIVSIRKRKVNWYNISEHQKLSEDFIREFEDEVHWGRISSEQNLSEDFIREFKETFEQARNCFHKEA